MNLVREPIYQQLNQLLSGLVASEEFPPGSKFLTERQICTRFGVSRATANKALSNLVSEGVLEFRKGVGTFVRSRRLGFNLHALVSFTDEAIAAGKYPQTRVLRFETLEAKQAPRDVASALEVEGEAGLLYMERLRLAGDAPVILERRYVVREHCPQLRESEAAGSIYAVWTRRYGLTIEGAEQGIRAVIVRGIDAARLELREGSAGLLITSTGYLDGHRPLWFERTLYRGDAYEFRNRLGGTQSSGQAAGRFLQSGGGAKQVGLHL